MLAKIIKTQSRDYKKFSTAPSSPVHNRRLLSAKNIRMSSVELPDDNEKSPSSASTSPCPSPVGGKVSKTTSTSALVFLRIYDGKSIAEEPPFVADKSLRCLVQFQGATSR